MGEYDQSVYRREMDVLYKRAQKALGRDVGADDDSGESDKDFEKERKQLLQDGKDK